MAPPSKPGRNDPCSCGSGLKFKKCCLPKTQSIKERIFVSKELPVFTPLRQAPPELQAKAIKMFEEKERKERERVARFGQIRPQMSVEWQGQRWVTVRNRIYYLDKNRWKFFPDFLRDYVTYVFGIEWCKAEAAKTESQRHPVITWRAHGAAYMNAQPPQPDGTRVALPSGALAAYTCFAYDLFVVDDNGGLDDELIRRLKHPEMFQGARHELFAEATCYRAGFTVQRENEKDGTSRHAEFTAKHTATGQLLSVEAKSRHRAGVLGRPGTPETKPDFRLIPLINDAVAKKPKHPLVIFIDANLPFKWAERILGQQAGNIPSRPMRLLLDKVKHHHNGADPYSMMVFSNHPHHFAILDLDPGPHLLSVVPQQPGANIIALQNFHMAATMYGNIPNSFSTEEGDPPQPVVPVARPQFRYDFLVNGTDVCVLREGKETAQQFLIKDKDRPQAPSPLHEFLEDISLPRVDAHAICEQVEAGKSVSGVYATK